MRKNRLYVDSDLVVGNPHSLGHSEMNYLKNVLRLQVGDEVILFNGSGFEYPARLAKVDKRLVELEVLDEIQNQLESHLDIELGLAITKGDRMDFSVQKSVELGVSSITPIFTQHGVVSLKGDRLAKKRQHWQKVAVSACEQCGRNRIPPVAEPLQLEDWLAPLYASESLRLVLAPGSGMNLQEISYSGESIKVLIGPEGGFNDAELSAALSAGFSPVTLGKRILRAETASLTIMGVLQFLWGDLG